MQVNDVIALSSTTVVVLPNECIYPVSRAKDFIHDEFQITMLNLINADENNTIIRQQLLQQLQLRVHHEGQARLRAYLRNRRRTRG